MNRYKYHGEHQSRWSDADANKSKQNDRYMGWIIISKYLAVVYKSPSDGTGVGDLKKLNCVPAPIIARVDAPNATETAEKVTRRTEDTTNTLMPD